MQTDTIVPAGSASKGSATSGISACGLHIHHDPVKICLAPSGHETATISKPHVHCPGRAGCSRGIERSWSCLGHTALFLFDAFKASTLVKLPSLMVSGIWLLGCHRAMHQARWPEHGPVLQIWLGYPRQPFKDKKATHMMALQLLSCDHGNLP